MLNFPFTGERQLWGVATPHLNKQMVDGIGIVSPLRERALRSSWACAEGSRRLHWVSFSPLDVSQYAAHCGMVPRTRTRVLTTMTIASHHALRLQ